MIAHTHTQPTHPFIRPSVRPSNPRGLRAEETAAERLAMVVDDAVSTREEALFGLRWEFQFAEDAALQAQRLDLEAREAAALAAARGREEAELGALAAREERGLRRESAAVREEGAEAAARAVAGHVEALDRAREEHAEVLARSAREAETALRRQLLAAWPSGRLTGWLAGCMDG